MNENAKEIKLYRGVELFHDFLNTYMLSKLKWKANKIMTFCLGLPGIGQSSIQVLTTYVLCLRKPVYRMWHDYYLLTSEEFLTKYIHWDNTKALIQTLYKRSYLYKGAIMVDTSACARPVQHNTTMWRAQLNSKFWIERTINSLVFHCQLTNTIYKTET